MTPLIIASYGGHSQVCASLIDKGHANINHQDNTRKTALTLAAYVDHANCVDVVKFLTRMKGVQLDLQGWFRTCKLPSVLGLTSVLTNGM